MTVAVDRSWRRTVAILAWLALAAGVAWSTTGTWRRHARGAAGVPSGAGRLILEFAPGSEPLPEALDLELLLVREEGRESQVQSMHLAGPSWEARVPRDAEYRLLRITEDGETSDRPANLSAWDDAGRLVVRIGVPDAATLVVVDASTGEPLPNARIIPTSRAEGGADERPRPHDLRGVAMALVVNHRGRLTLPPSGREERWWAVAAGYATAEVRTLPRWGEVRVPLTRAAGARFRWSPAGSAPTNFRIVLTREESDSDVEALPTGVVGEYVADDLAPGTWRATAGTAETGTLFDSVLDEATFRVEAGLVTDVTLTARLAGDMSRSPEGDLRVPAGWHSEPSALVFQGMGRGNGIVSRTVPLVDDGTGTRWTFRVPQGLPAGPYQVHLIGLAWSTVVRLPATPRPVHLEVPPPVFVAVRVTAAGGGSDVRDAYVVLFVVPEDPGESVAETSIARPARGLGIRAERAADGAAYLAEVPAGRVRAFVAADGFVSARRVATVPATKDTFEIAVALETGEGEEPEPDGK